MDQNSQNYEGVEIDLSKYVKMIIKRKRTLILVFILTLVIGVSQIINSPKIYRTTMMIQPPVVGPSLTGANDLETAENLKGLIVNGVFNEKVVKTLNLDFSSDQLEFRVVIPSQTNILQVSLYLDSNNKELSIPLLQILNMVIADNYTKNIEARITDTDNQIKLNESAITNTQERAKSFQDRIKGIIERENKLRDEAKDININMSKVLDKSKLLKESPNEEYANTLLLANYIQNNSNLLFQLNKQISDLSLLKADLSLELNNIDTKIINYQTEINKLNTSKSFISNLKIIEQPRVSPNPINPGKKKILSLYIVMGLIFGVIAVFLQEFWVNKIIKK